MSATFDLFRGGIEPSLRNSERWLKDAKLLIQDGSYGHAYALLTFADEELIKAYTFWMLPLLPEEIISEIDPMKVFRYIFLGSHRKKHTLILDFLMGIYLAQEFSEKGREKAIEDLEKQIEEYSQLSEEEIKKIRHYIGEIIKSKETMRQRSIYVDLDKGGEKILSPEEIKKENVENLLEGVKLRLERVKQIINMSESKKEKLKDLMKDLTEKVV